MVSLPFTCVKNIYGNYIRNYIDTVKVTKNIQHGKRPPSVATYKLLGIVVGYIVNSSQDNDIVKYSQQFTEHYYYNMLLPYNDFISPQQYGISSNVPAVDNSIAVYKIADKHLLIIVR